MGKIIAINEFRKLEEQKSVPAHSSANSSTAFARATHPPAAPSEILKAIEDKNIAILSRIRAPSIHSDIRHYKRYSANYKLLRAVFENDLDQVKALFENYANSIEINAATYWHYPAKADVHFLTPAHLVKSPEMAELLKSRGADMAPYLRSFFTLVKPTPA